jgi:predicted nucleic acid-binding protein
VGLIQEVRGGAVALDTVAFIYLIEEHPLFLPVVEPVFAAMAAGRIEAVSSSLTLLEVLVVPYRASDLQLAHRYEQLLTQSRGLRLIEIDRTQLRAAAQLRGVHRALKTPDALQLCAALGGGCATFVTNDRDLPSISGLRILQIRDYVEGKG